MDPQVTLAAFIAAIAGGHFREASRQKEDLIGWIDCGGFQPDWEGTGWTLAKVRAWKLTKGHRKQGTPRVYRFPRSQAPIVNQRSRLPNYVELNKKERGE